MSESADRPAAHIEVLAATPEEQPVLANFWSYTSTISASYSGWRLVTTAGSVIRSFRSIGARSAISVAGASGREAGRLCAVKKGEAVAGSEVVWDVGGVFVLRAYRRRGVGTHVAHEVWTLSRAMGSLSNGGESFCAAVLGGSGCQVSRRGFSPVRVQKDGEWRQVFSFES